MSFGSFGQFTSLFWPRKARPIFSKSSSKLTWESPWGLQVLFRAWPRKSQLSKASPPHSLKHHPRPKEAFDIGPTLVVLKLSFHAKRQFSTGLHQNSLHTALFFTTLRHHVASVRRKCGVFIATRDRAMSHTHKPTRAASNQHQGSRRYSWG